MIVKKAVILFATVAFCFMSNCVGAETTVAAGDMVITSKLMTLFKNIYVARGGVRAENKDSVMTADRGIYDRDLEIVKAIENVKVTQPGSVLSSDYLEAYVREDRILARGNPKLVRIMERVSTNAETGRSETKKSRIILTCNEIEAFQKENIILSPLTGLGYTCRSQTGFESIPTVFSTKVCFSIDHSDTPHALTALALINATPRKSKFQTTLPRTPVPVIVPALDGDKFQV